MNIDSFTCLYDLLHTRGRLVDDGLINIEEHVAIFVHILAHHKKNHSIQVTFRMSDETVSGYVHRVLCALLGVIIFGSIWFLSKQSNQNRFKKNRTETGSN